MRGPSLHINNLLQASHRGVCLDVVRNKQGRRLISELGAQPLRQLDHNRGGRCFNAKPAKILGKLLNPTKLLIAAFEVIQHFIKKAGS